MTRDTVRITTDCVCDLTSELKRRYHIPIMYYYVQTEEVRFQDVREMTSDDLIEYMEPDGKKAYSSCAPEEEYREFFESQRKKTDAPIIHICMAQHVSDAFKTAKEAARQFEEIYVVDSGHLSGGMGIMVLTAADMAKRGASCEVILDELERIKGKVSTSFIVESVECLYRNGKIGKHIARLCSLFSLHPILNLSDSHMKPAGVCIGSQRRFARAYLRWVLRKKDEIVPDVVFLITAGCSYEFQQLLKEEIRKRVPFKTIVVNKASATISCNCGPGAFGVLFLRK